MPSAPWAVFGGSFNPPHVGHVLAVSYVLSVYPLAGVLVIPVYQHPFAKELASYEDRLEMARLAMGWIPNVLVSDVERTLGGESRTLFTIEALLRERPERALRLVVGADVLADLPKWHRFDRIAELAPPIILGRAGISAPAASIGGRPDVLLPDVSSTDIRRRFENGESATLEPLLPYAVRAYIAARGLYPKAPSPALPPLGGGRP